MSPLTQILNDLKCFGITRIDISLQNKMTRQNITLIFKNYSKPYLAYQKYLLDKAIDSKQEKLQKELENLKLIKLEINKIVEDGKVISKGQ
jgi:hypothetical protein